MSELLRRHFANCALDLETLREPAIELGRLELSARRYDLTFQ